MQTNDELFSAFAHIIGGIIDVRVDAIVERCHMMIPVLQYERLFAFLAAFRRSLSLACLLAADESFARRLHAA